MKEARENGSRDKRMQILMPGHQNLINQRKGGRKRGGKERKKSVEVLAAVRRCRRTTTVRRSYAYAFFHRPRALTSFIRVYMGWEDPGQRNLYSGRRYEPRFYVVRRGITPYSMKFVGM